MVRLVPSSTWNDIYSLFPDAITHNVIRLEDGFQNCILCQEEKGKTSDFSTRLLSWADAEPAIDMTDCASEESSRNKTFRFFLVQSDNIRIWKKARDAVKRSRKRKSSAANTEKLKNQILGLFTSCFKNQKNDEPASISHCLRRLTCWQHNKALQSLKIFQDLITDTELDPTAKDAIDIPISLMTEHEFLTYSSSLSHLEEILFDSGKEELKLFLHQSSPQLLVSGISSDDCQKLKGVTDIIAAKSCWLNDGGKTELVDAPCIDESCNAKFLDYIQDSLGNGDPSPSKQKRDAEVVEVPQVHSNEKYTFQVHEFSSSIDRKTSEDMLAKQRLEGIKTAMRRSARRRGTGANLFSLEINKSDNLAQLRLRVYENSNSKSLSTHMLSVFYFVEASQEGVTMELLGEWNEKTMDEVLTSLPLKVVDDPTITLVLNTQENNDQIKTSGERKEMDDSLFDLLVHMATSSDKDETFTPKNGRGRKRREERGFAGTFLQSSFNAPSSTTDENIIITDKVEATIDLTDSPSSKRAATSKIFNCDEVVIDENNTFNNSHDFEDCGQVASGAKGNPAGIETETGSNAVGEVSDTINDNPKMASMIACIYEMTIEEWSNLSPLHLHTDNVNKCKYPKVPQYANSIDIFTSDEVSQILERGKGDNDDDRESLKQQLLFSSEARNLFRNFMAHPPIKCGHDLPLSRREMDIILYSIKKEGNISCSGSCKNLIPYRSERCLKYLLKRLQETNIVFDSKYGEYMEYVASYVEKLDQLEENLVVAVGGNI